LDWNYALLDFIHSSSFPNYLFIKVNKLVAH